MLSLQGLISILGLPIKLVFSIFHYYLGTHNFRKYEKRLLICLKMTFYRAGLAIPIADTKYISLSNNTVFKLFKLTNGAVAKSLPHYGERYGTSGIWFARDDARSAEDPVIIYSHGGGYFMQTQVEQLQSLAALYKSIDPSKRVSILFLDYDLVCTGAKFPRQVRQLDSIYTKLVREGNTNLILFGDSAGGHLSITYTRFLKERKPYLPTPTKLLLVSPWVDMAVRPEDNAPGTSYFENLCRDMITFELFSSGPRDLFITERARARNQYFHWSYKEPTNWTDIPFFNDSSNEIFLVFGEDESFRDHLYVWLKQVYDVPVIPFGTSENKPLPEFELKLAEKNKPKLTAYVEPWGLHDSFFFMEYGALKEDLKHLDDEKYFALVRLTKYLNESL